MDEPSHCDYLGRIMFRRLLACLALITGLAAAAAPAHASVAESVGAQLEMTQRVEDGTRAEESPCAERQRQQRQKGVKVTPCKPSEPVTVYIPTVQFGPDRAFE